MLGQMNDACRTTFARMAIFAALTTVSCGEIEIPGSVSLVGTWDWVGLEVEGVAAAVTGTVVFRTDGTFSIDGTFTFPEQPTYDFVVDGPYVQSDDNVALTVESETSNWAISASGNQVTLTLDEPPPASTITLQRR